MERNKQFAKDILVYGIGNIGNKFLVFLLFPVLTFFLAREELGYYDISLEAILFLLPVVTLQMRESTFRLLIDARDASYRKHILTTTFFIEAIIFAIVLVIASVIPFFFAIRHFPLIIISIYAYALYELYLQAVRAVYSSTQYVIVSSISSVLTVTMIALFYFVFKRGIEALFIGNIISRLSAIVITEILRGQIVRDLSFRFFKKVYIKEIFQYTIPMMWMAIAYGFIIISGKYVVNYYMGTENIGILAPAQKYMSIMIILGVSFHQAWQVAAVNNYREKGSERFFSEVFNKYTVALCLFTLCISFGLRSFKSILMGPAFYPSVDLIYIYCVSAVFFCLASFLEVTYQCTKQTSKVYFSMVSCAVLSFPLTIVLTKYFGLTGMITALTIAYIYLFIFRYFQTKSILPVRINKEFFPAIILLVTGGIIFYQTSNRMVDYVVLTVSSLLLIYYLLIIKKKMTI